MKVIVYGDFNCPYSYLASQRADRLARGGIARVDWRAVEAVSDGIADELRRSLFAAVWAEGRHIGSAYEVRRLVAALTWPQEDVTDRLSSPDIASLLIRDPDPRRAVRRWGGTVALNGEPLTTTGWRRIRRWRQDWLGLPSQVIPAVVGHDQLLRSGTEALRYLARLSGTGNMSPPLPARAETGPGPGSRRLAA